MHSSMMVRVYILLYDCVRCNVCKTGGNGCAGSEFVCILFLFFMYLREKDVPVAGGKTSPSYVPK